MSVVGEPRSALEVELDVGPLAASVWHASQELKGKETAGPLATGQRLLPSQRRSPLAHLLSLCPSACEWEHSGD